MPTSTKRAAAIGRAVQLLVVIGQFTAAGCSRLDSDSPRARQQRLVATSASAVRLLDLDDKPVNLQQVCKGSVHVVVFIRSDCPISNRMAPQIRELCQQFQPQGVDFHLVYVDPHEKPEAIRTHLREYEYPCPALRDLEHTLAAQTEAEVTPEAVVFNSDWKITYRGRISDLFEDFGKMRDTPSKNDLRDAITATLAGQPVTEPVTKAIGCYIRDLK